MGIFRRGAGRRKTPPRLDPNKKYPDYINPGPEAEPALPGETDFFAQVEESTDQPAVAPQNPPRKIGVLTLTRGAAVLCVIGLTFLIVWVFILGILVGRGTIFQTEAFQQLEDKLLDKNVDEFAQALEITEEKDRAQPPAASDKTALTFFEDLTKTKKESEPRVEPPDAPLKQPPLKKDAAAKPQSPAPAFKLQEPVAAPKTAAPKPVAAVKSADAKTKKTLEPPERNPGENFTVQVAAARTLEEADRMIGRLNKQGFDAYYYQYVSNNKKYYRIRVGRYKTRADAQVALDRLTEKGYGNMFLSSLGD
ncbi:MAG: SPOR domain-containing protein [Pseudomonadota bacterium]